MNNPLVSVICLNYNQGKFLAETLDSVLDQTYRNFELLIVDDGSTDDSEEIIKHYKRLHPEIEIFILEENVGNCKAFNIGLQAASGKYIIDLAADDILFPERLQLQVEALEKLDDSYAMCFTDAVHVEENGKLVRNHYKRDKKGKLIEYVPSGNLYKDVLERHFICTPTMMMKTSCLLELGGYDEDLSYEDFDYWVCTAKQYKFHYLDKVLTAKRDVATSKSSGWYKKGDPQLHSTYLVCLKALNFENTNEEIASLAKRVKFEFRQAVFSDNKKEGKLFYELLQELTSPTLFYKLLFLMNKWDVKYSSIRGLYYKVFHSNS